MPGPLALPPSLTSTPPKASADTAKLTEADVQEIMDDSITGLGTLEAKVKEIAARSLEALKKLGG